MKILNVGCGPFRPDELINLEKEDLDIRGRWNYDDNSVDGITSSHVLIELTGREIISAFKEMHRVLKPGGVLRICVPHIDSGKDIDFLTGWGNITILSYELLYKILEKIGFGKIYKVNFKETKTVYSSIVLADNRPDETLFMEAIK